ncbi:trans-2,3-dihydro-3-hydroxyanthranilate isomerase [Yoonia maricola]|uniref:Trans-2,3-dihydro-3-hydroxyanthranilate isomerase n=1 Tax=Yoonia maricola TaxID=420999 RepID=A0A2M8WL19_9RHOB|nr:PhzF family phenazine biosynthesis protein [Yoonia maricola]PJI91623.1 trans-2,3-dihydro-3-hydroxyanthranilate isomerase [Yoonia maricola]
MSSYSVYDVFTDAAFGGNQLAVFPDATNIAEDKLQSIAREFNFSEVTFVYPPKDSAHTARVRIFTPTMEIPFAGHPTIGTAIALRDAGHDDDAMILELEIGPIPCFFENDKAAFKVATPLTRVATPAIDVVAAALGLTADAIKRETHAPVQAGVGLPFVVVELRDKGALNACAPSLDHIRKGAAQYPAGLDFAIFAYVRDGMRIDARMFAPLDNIPEDPATGSAAAALAALLTEELGQNLTLNILQGEAMGRPSYITAATQHADPVPVTISGQAVRVMQGTLLI